MKDEVYSFSLKHAINEIQKICPDIKTTFIFEEDGEILVSDENTADKTVRKIVDSFRGLPEKVDVMRNIECLILESGKGRMDIVSMNNFYVTTVVSKGADMKYVKTVNRVLFPTLLRLLEKSHPTPLKNIASPPEPEQEIPLEEELEDKVDQVDDEAVKEVDQEEVVSPAEDPLTDDAEEKLEMETPLEEPSTYQLIVENLGGLLVPSDTVRIDVQTLSEWEESLNGEKVSEVEVETFDGKTTRCKVKPLKDSKFKGKGIIRMPEKIQSRLEVDKGSLVRVKPALN